MIRSKWTIGQVEVFQIIELEAGDLIQTIIKNATPENIRQIGWLHPQFADSSGKLHAFVQTFLLKSGGLNILIDTCNGNDKPRVDVPEWSNLQTNFLDQLSSVGVAPTDVHIVACTHLHMDHVGWNTRLSNGSWVPTFPNARYLFARREYEYWQEKPAKEIADDKTAFDDSVMPIVNAGLASFVETNHQIDPHVRFIPTPGHTPAHASVLIESRNQRAIISGDFVHHPCQIAKPAWGTDADTSPDDAIKTRERILSEIANTDTLLIGSHFAEPVAGRVIRHQDGFLLQV